MKTLLCINVLLTGIGLLALPVGPAAPTITPQVVSMTPAATSGVNESPAKPDVVSSAPPLVKKHYFVPSVDTPTLCHVCGETIYNEIHPWKNVSAIEPVAQSPPELYTQPAPVKPAQPAKAAPVKYTQPQPVYYSGGSCSGPGCGRSFGWRLRRR